MAEVTALHVWMRDKKKEWKQAGVINQFGNQQPGKRVIIKVGSNWTPSTMKIEVAKVIKKYKRQLYYYYVVVEVKKEDGDFAYKTMVGRTTP